MKKWEEQNPGGVNGIGEEKVDLNGEAFGILRQKIVADAQKQTRKQVLENKVLSIKLHMLAYLHESISGNIIEVGEFLKDLLRELEIKNNRFAEYIDLHPANLSSLLRGRRKINTQMAIKLGDIFNISSDIWMKIQTKNDLIQTREMLQKEKRRYNLGDLIEM